MLLDVAKWILLQLALEGWFEFGTWFQSPSSSMKHEKQDVASTDWEEITNMQLVPHT
jgi:hypothetical protein